MKHEHIIKREDGSSVKIEIDVTIYGFFEAPKYGVSISTRAPRKHKWRHHPMKWDSEANDHCSAAEIKAAKLEAWHKMKP